MAIDASIYGRNPLRSVADYEGDYQRQAMNQQAMQQNALALKTGEMGLQDRQRAVEEAGIVRNALAQLGPNAADPDRINALKRTGTQTGFAAADALEKALIAREKEGAATAKTRVETQGLTDKQKRDAIQFNLQSLAAVNNPQQYASWLDGGVKSGLMTQQEAEAEKTRIPQTPQEFAQLKQQQMMAGVDLAKQFDIKAAAARDAEAGRSNLAREKNAAGQLGVAQANLGLSRERLNVEKAAPKGVIQDTENGLMLVDPRAGTAAPVTANGAPVKGKQAAGAGQPSEDERKAAGYAIRMEGALKKLAEVGEKNPEALKPGVGTSLINMAPEGVANYMRSAPRQRIETAQVDALDAALTLATGAAYTKEQLKGLSRSYFTQPGDDAATIKDKEQRLAEVIETARIRAGRAAPAIDKMDAARPGVASAGGSFSDAEKERRYQEWKAKQK